MEPYISPGKQAIPAKEFDTTTVDPFIWPNSTPTTRLSESFDVLL